MKKSLKWQQFLLLLLMGTSLYALQACSESDGEIELENGNVLVNDHEAVDLGLSVKWATCNLGSDTPEGSGNCYAWGETAVKNNCSWSNYAWGNGGNNKLTKYCVDKSYGTVDNRLTLSSSDDPATKAWGKKWRTPTKDEIKELVQKCVWSSYGDGYEITGPNGKSITLPAAGYCDGSNVEDRGDNGYYWSSSLDASDNSRAYLLNFDERNSDPDNEWADPMARFASRYLGFAIRPVTGDAEMRAPEVMVSKGAAAITSGTSITLSATIASDGGDEVTERGFCYSTTFKTPQINDSKKAVDSENVVFSATIDNLKRGSTCYIRAYAINSKGVGYSEVVSVTVPSLVSDYEAVDLGLSVKWATCNYGATAPEEVGEYVWINTYEVEGWTNWRIPTEEELRELEYDCTWEWTTYKGMNGQLVTGPNGNSIFLPAAGSTEFGCSQCWEELSYETTGLGEYGYYMSSDYNNAYANIMFKRPMLCISEGWCNVDKDIEISHWVNVQIGGFGRLETPKYTQVTHYYQGRASLRLVTDK